MQSLETDIKQLIIDTLNLEEISVDEIESEAALFGNEGLGLDSIDALELGLAVKKRYGVVLSAENETMREHFYSVASLAAFINSQNPAHSA
jgi:acyl carrier protein